MQRRATAGPGDEDEDGDGEGDGEGPSAWCKASRAISRTPRPCLTASPSGSGCEGRVGRRWFEAEQQDRPDGVGKT